MPSISIDGKDFEFEGQHMLLQFALDNGIEIPYFCYHPAMSIPTNCRMCLVEVGWTARDRATGEVKKDEAGNPVINWGRKPNTSCNTPISDGMVVKTRNTSQQVFDMQKGVLEYMLVNHPLDCPICDQAGECPLQIWTYKYGPEGSRFESAKIHKPKRVELGPNVILDAERCINCTRCTRFTEEVSGSWQLTIAGRGDKNYPTTAPGETFDDPYSMNVIDLCPVGALTSRDFRFKARVWEMAYTPGVCTGCSRGCNVDVWTRDNEVLRLTPRENLEVNQYWMCDEGRLAISQYGEHRVSGIRSHGGVPIAEFTDGISRTAGLLKANDGEFLLLGSPYASLESNFALRKLGDALGVKNIYYIPSVEEGWGDDFLRKDDRTPNSGGCELLNFVGTDVDNVLAMLNNDQLKLFYMLEDQRFLAAEGLSDALKNVRSVIHATNHLEVLSDANMVLPAASPIEGESTFVNFEGKAQVTKMAKEISRMTPEMWMRLPKSRLDKAAVGVDRWRNLDNIHDVLPSWLLIAQVAEAMGHDWGWKEHKHVFAAMQAEVDAVKELKVSYKVPKEAFKVTQYDFAIS